MTQVRTHANMTTSDDAKQGIDGAQRMIPAILIWRDGHETEQSVPEGADVRVSGTSFRRVGMQRSRFVYVEAVDQPRTLSAVPGDAS